MNRIISAIGHFVKHSAVWVSQKFVALFGSDAAHNLAVAAESVLKSQIGKITLTAVEELMAVKIPGSEKAAQAMAKIAAAAKEAGIEIARSEINLLIEVAVQKLKANFGSGDAPPAAS